MNTIVGGHPISRLRMLVVVAWIASLGIAFLAGAIAFRERHALRQFIRTAISGRVVQSSLYNIAVQTVPIPGHGRDGGVDALDDGLLLANRLGEMWFVTSARELQPVTLTIPINVDAFNSDPHNNTTDLRDQFSVKDILVQQRPDGVRLLASYNYWHADDDCYVLRVSDIETTTAALRGNTSAPWPAWRTLFETTPCLPLEIASGIRNPTKDAGGRLVALSDGEVLLSVGRFGVRGGEDSATDYSRGVQSADNSYGKVVLINLETRDSRIYSIGHRTPEGMTISPDGTVFLTEHGPRGGDELNRIVEGRNYGWPIVTYGTQYNSLNWSDIYSRAHHEGFEKPVYAWVPSIGISQLIAVQGKAFQKWAGDLMVSSLVGQTLYRMRLAEGRAVVVEPIQIGHRIRDLVELSDGAIALKTDDDYVLFLEPLERTRLDGLDAVARGHVVAGRCSGCHSLAADGPDGIGPSLWGVVGRKVGARKQFPYSPALTSIGGAWSTDRLRAYISNPQSLAPGTRMERVAVPDSQSLEDLLAFLDTLQ